MTQKAKAPSGGGSLKSNSEKSFCHNKDIKYLTQLQIVREQFSKYPQTMLMCSYATGIERAGICRYLAKLEKAGQVELIRKGFCEITKHRAGYYFAERKEAIDETL